MYGPERKTMKCMEINVEGVCLVCIMDTQTNKDPYKLYRVWYNDGYHRKLLKRYANFVSVVEHVCGYCHATHWGFKESYFDWGR